MSDKTGIRPPVVTILGHVDHGKTSLLDRIRHAAVAAGEIGGITQAIGAYQIEHEGKELTFIDTPGHAAFSEMRRRGGQAADIAILIVAADDSVMPQTRESIEHIKKAGIPFVVAVNKIDLPGVSIEKVKTDLANEGVYVEGYGGNVPLVGISAKSGAGVEELLEIILLLAELEDLKDTSEETPATALVIESSLHPQKGPLATILVKNGTFKQNANLFDGTLSYGKIRSMTNFLGKTVTVAGPSMPVQVIGFSIVPNVGDVITDAPEAVYSKEIQTSVANEMSIEKPNIILKADVQGSLEAILQTIKDEVNIISATVGMVNDSDIQNALSSHAEILGFNSKMPSSVSKLAEIEHVKFTNFRIIYQLFDYLKELKEKNIAAQGPKKIEIGQLKILKVFKFGANTVYGCAVVSGKIRIGDKVLDSKITSIQMNKADVEEVKKDQEFGLVVSPNIDLKAGDIIQSYTEE